MGKKIEFISTVEGLEEIEECRPKPAKHFVPEWFKNIPSFSENIPTVRHCPSFPDFFSKSALFFSMSENSIFWYFLLAVKTAGPVNVE